MISGESVAVKGTIEQVEKVLSDAARSGQSRMAWFGQADGSGRVGINPAHVATLKPSPSDE